MKLGGGSKSYIILLRKKQDKPESSVLSQENQEDDKESIKKYIYYRYSKVQEIYIQYRSKVINVIRFCK